MTLVIEGYEEFTYTINDSLKITKICDIDYAEWNGETVNSPKNEIQITIEATPTSQTESYVEEQTVKIKAKCTKQWENWNATYAWNGSDTQQPTDDDWKSLTLTQGDNSLEKRGEVISTSKVEGSYYLWVKVETNGKSKMKCFGPYNIKEKPTEDYFVCSLKTKNEDETVGIYEVGSSKEFEGWTLSYQKNNEEYVEITTLKKEIEVKQNDIITLKYSKEGNTDITKTFNVTELKVAYKIIYELNGGESGPEVKTQYDNKVFEISSTIPTRTGYTFVKWTTNQDGSGTSYTSGQKNVTVDDTLTLYAQWEETITARVTFNNNNQLLKDSTVQIECVADSGISEITLKIGTATVYSEQFTEERKIYNEKISVEQLNLDELAINTKYTSYVTVLTVKSNTGNTKNTSAVNVKNYVITSAYGLQQFRNLVNVGNTYSGITISQLKDIDLNSQSWTPIGNANNSIAFSGIYDGNNKKIENLSINNTTNYQGLFGYVNGGTVKDLTVSGSVIGGSGTAALVGKIYSGKIENCHNEATVTHEESYIVWSNGNEYAFVGGVVGLAEGTTEINNCSNSAKIECHSVTFKTSAKGFLTVGGIVGFIDDVGDGTTVNACSNLGEIKISYISKSTLMAINAGIVGSMWKGTVTNCYNTGKIWSVETNYITQSNCSGGIVGYIQNATVQQCWNSGTIENDLAGGITCRNETGVTVKDCYNKGNVKANYKCGFVKDVVWTCAGGISAWNHLNSNINNCYNMGVIETNGCNLVESDKAIGGAGGITGWNATNMTNVYNVGNVNANPSTTDKRGAIAGGISGGINGNAVILNSYNIGAINVTSGAVTYIGGIAGWSESGTSKAQNVYNIGQLDSNATYRGGVLGWYSKGSAWMNWYWLKQTNLNECGNNTATANQRTSAQLKALVSSGELPSESWGTNSNINDGYPYLTVFDDTSIWLRNSSVNGGEPYLKDNLPLELRD